MTQPRVGLARALSKMGYCSRSQAVLLIRSGRVAVNGHLIRNPESGVRLPDDRIEVDGSLIERALSVYLVMNKPRGVVTTAADEKNRKTVYDLLEPGLPWVGPVGRLDKASEGLLLMTNDSEWAANITEPSSHLKKIYHVQVNCIADTALLAKITSAGPTEDAIEEDEAELLRAKAACIL